MTRLTFPYVFDEGIGVFFPNYVHQSEPQRTSEWCHINLQINASAIVMVKATVS